jgi:hypothetical protein
MPCSLDCCQALPRTATTIDGMDHHQRLCHGADEDSRTVLCKVSLDVNPDLISR